ncbi:NK-tumor recognition protein [Cucumis melo var. makuwa]|uniref:NK-tumor recognition protein n=1 Tax=Cucumis melo var. makuwa TaxID=1194695 RepID=A0A5D3DWF0_CUCMM|nr:NK-tumor recognition protein [Cucumis melo var. makuwa]TYK27961.1 NK-tumor recognition protein [Cucumis melo var. makuwa]
MKRSRRKSKSSRKLKSKKQRYRHDSPSCSDTDFESSTSVPSSSSEDDKKVRRSRSKTRKNVKPSKKRFKKQSHDRQSRECSPNPRKRKHSKRNDRREVNKANKKKRRRDVSVGHSDSLSCSTCGNGTTTSNESEVVRRRGRFAKRKGNMRKTGSGRYMSKSRSPCSLHSEGSDYQNEVDDDSYVEKNFRRLRSIIVVVGEENKLKTFVGNEQQEVTNQLSDDHPSSGEMDSKDATGKRGLDYVVTKEALVVENEKEVDVPNYRNSMVVKDGGVQNEGSNKNHGGVTNDHSSDEIKNGCSDNTDSINCIDLESMLRQRALENLRKFKGASPRNVETIANCKVDHNNAAKQLRSPVSDSVHVTSPRNNAEINSKRFSRQGGGNAINSMILKENGVKSMDAIDSAVATMHDPVYSSQNLGKISNGSNGMNEQKQDISSLDQEVINDNICQKADADICSTTNRSNLVIAALRPEPKVDSLIKQTSAAQESVQTKPSISDVGVGETAQIQTQMRNNDDLNIRNGLGSSAYEPSSLNSISGEDSLNMSNQESGESSQFEQKTMSVMRGGEMVQVNYKVYIPKRAPALTRRQLKRGFPRVYKAFSCSFDCYDKPGIG